MDLVTAGVAAGGFAAGLVVVAAAGTEVEAAGDGGGVVLGVVVAAMVAGGGAVLAEIAPGENFPADKVPGWDDGAAVKELAEVDDCGAAASGVGACGGVEVGD